MDKIPEEFIVTCQNMVQWSLDTELYANVGYNSVELVRFFVEDKRLPNHANINGEDGRCLHLCSSIEMLNYLIIEGGLQLTPKILEDIKDNKIRFGNQALELFKITDFYNKLNDKYKRKDKKKQNKI